jgi:hypothetical protein
MIEKIVHTAKHTVKATVDIDSAQVAWDWGGEGDLSVSVMFWLRQQPWEWLRWLKRKAAGQNRRVPKSGSRQI